MSLISARSNVASILAVMLFVLVASASSQTIEKQRRQFFGRVPRLGLLQRQPSMSNSGRYSKCIVS